MEREEKSEHTHTQTQQNCVGRTKRPGTKIINRLSVCLHCCCWKTRTAKLIVSFTLNILFLFSSDRTEFCKWSLTVLQFLMPSYSLYLKSKRWMHFFHVFQHFSIWLVVAACDQYKHWSLCEHLCTAFVLSTLCLQGVSINSSTTTNKMALKS